MAASRVPPAAWRPPCFNAPVGQPLQPYVVIANPGYAAATWSLVCGILAYLCLPIIGAVLAVILGISSMSSTRAYGFPRHAAAVVGVVLGLIQLGFVGLFLQFFAWSLTGVAIMHINHR